MLIMYPKIFNFLLVITNTNMIQSAQKIKMQYLTIKKLSFIKAKMNLNFLMVKKTELSYNRKWYYILKIYQYKSYLKIFGIRKNYQQIKNTLKIMLLFKISRLPCHSHYNSDSIRNLSAPQVLFYAEIPDGMTKYCRRLK